MKTRIIIFVYFLCVLSSCGFDAGKAVESDAAPVISPDYSAITIPVNIAPLDFLMRPNLIVPSSQGPPEKK